MNRLYPYLALKEPLGVWDTLRNPTAIVDDYHNCGHSGDDSSVGNDPSRECKRRTAHQTQPVPL
jgi:hypothetical protein